MATKCGCSGTATCSCVVKGISPIVVTGNGSSASPYLVSMPGTNLSVLDTPTVDLTLVGTVLSADVKISTAAGNILTVDGTGLLVLDVDVATTVTALDTNTVNTTVTGGPAYVVSSDVIISPVAGNLLTATPAGLLVANPVITLKTQARLLTTGQSWTPGTDVLGILTAVGFSVLVGTADLVDFNGTLSAGLPVSASASWSALDGNVLTGPQSITAQAGSTLVTWTEQ